MKVLRLKSAILCAAALFGILNFGWSAMAESTGQPVVQEATEAILPRGTAENPVQIPEPSRALLFLLGGGAVLLTYRQAWVARKKGA